MKYLSFKYFRPNCANDLLPGVGTQLTYYLFIAGTQRTTFKTNPNYRGPNLPSP